MTKFLILLLLPFSVSSQIHMFFFNPGQNLLLSSSPLDKHGYLSEPDQHVFSVVKNAPKNDGQAIDSIYATSGWFYSFDTDPIFPSYNIMVSKLPALSNYIDSTILSYNSLGKKIKRVNLTFFNAKKTYESDFSYNSLNQFSLAPNKFGVFF